MQLNYGGILMNEMLKITRPNVDNKINIVNSDESYTDKLPTNSYYIIDASCADTRKKE